MQRGQTPATIMVLLVITMLMTPTSSLQAKQTAPRRNNAPSLTEVGLYPTKVVATVRSLQRVKNSTLDLRLGEKQALFLIKLRIHTTRPLTLQGTLLNDDESLDVISREPIDTAFIGKVITAQIEMRGDSTRQCWLMTDVVIRSR